MHCRLVRKKLSAYLDNELTDTSESVLRQHLSTCLRCQAVRSDLALSRSYLRQLKEMPTDEFAPDIQQLLKPRQPAFLSLVFSKPALLVMLCLSAASWIYWLMSLPQDFSGLKEGSQTNFNTARPTIISVARNSWVSIDGECSLYKGKNYIKFELANGGLCFVLDGSAAPPVIIDALGFQVSSLHTEFSVRLQNRKIDVWISEGRLLVKYAAGKDIKAMVLSSGQGCQAAVMEGVPSLTNYGLSDSQRIDLARRLDRIKKIARFARDNPKQKSFESGDIRIELWKGD